MLDCLTRWDNDDDWPGGSLASGAIETRRVALPGQYLVSGNLAAFAAVSGMDPQGAGALGLVTGEAYTIRLARDRILFAGSLPPGLVEGWNAAGFAISLVSSAYAVIEFTGLGLSNLLAAATALDRAAPGPSAAISFAGLPAILYCHGSPDRLRLHIERGFGAYIKTWLNKAF